MIANRAPSDRSSLIRYSSTFVSAKAAALQIRDLYDRSGVSLNRQSSLGRLIDDAVNLADAWTQGTIVDDRDPFPLFRGQHLDRIAAAALPLAGVAKNKHHLLALKRGELSPLWRGQSSAKDKLWELELWSTLNRHGVPAQLAEPDIIATTQSGPIAIACKRIYSYANARSSMSYGVQQIGRTGFTGLLAVAVEDLYIPSGNWLAASSLPVARDMLGQMNVDFLNRHHSTLTEYFSKGKLASMLVATSAPLWLADEGIRDCQELQFWTPPLCSEAGRQHMAEFQDLLSPA